MGWNIPWKILKSGTSSGDTGGLVAPQEEDTEPLIQLGHLRCCVYELVIYFVCISLTDTHGVLEPGCAPSGGSGGS